MGIDLVRVSKAYGATSALSNISLSIDDGEFVVFLGPSGCGKSTLLEVVSGLTTPDSGEIHIDGRDVTGQDGRARNLAMVFQSYALYPHLTAARNIEFPLRARKMPRTERATRVTDVAASYGLTEHLHKRPGQLSGGQQQRVALARATVREPAAFLMDEPLSNLDAALRATTRSYLRELHRRLDATILYVTHDQVEAMTLATRVILLRDGQILQDCCPEQLYDRPETTFAATFVGTLPMNLVDATLTPVAGGVEARAGDVRVAVPLPPDRSLIDRPVTIGVRPEALRISTDAAAITGTVTAVENLGHELIVYVAAGAADLRVRAARSVTVRRGDRIGLDADELHIFDPATGNRLEWHPNLTSPSKEYV